MRGVQGGQGVRQLNHPFADSKLGREQGFLRAIGYDPRTPIAPGAGFAADVLLRTPGAPGGRRNIDWDVQEVMNGASRADWLRYRALWFSLLSQGIVRAGTANSDSHSLALEQVGYPRNLVFCEPYAAAPTVPSCTDDKEGLDRDKFNDEVRRGHMVGSNGPVLSRHDRGRDERVYRPGLDPIRCRRLPRQLVIDVCDRALDSRDRGARDRQRPDRERPDRRRGRYADRRVRRPERPSPRDAGPAR